MSKRGKPQRKLSERAVQNLREQYENLPVNGVYKFFREAAKSYAVSVSTIKSAVYGTGRYVKAKKGEENE